MSATDRSRRFAELAPLTTSFAMHLASYLLRSKQRPVGRPQKGDGEDVVTRAERRLLAAMDQLIPLVQTKRQIVYDLVHPVVSSGHLTNKWLLQTLSQLTPGTMMVYPQRLAEWRQAHLLLYNAAGEPEPNSVCCLLLARMINPNRTGWLPRPPGPESYWCWRRDAPGRAAFPFEMPLVAVNPEHPETVRIEPPREASPYVLFTPWKGASWDDTAAWEVTDQGAVRWVGLPSEELLAQWLSPQELASLAPSASQADRARQALRLLATDFLAHRSSSDDSA